MASFVAVVVGFCFLFVFFLGGGGVVMFFFLKKKVVFVLFCFFSLLF